MHELTVSLSSSQAILRLETLRYRARARCSRPGWPLGCFFCCLHALTYLRMAAPTHTVTNQVPPLVGYDVYGTDSALDEAVERHAAPGPAGGDHGPS